MWQSLLRHENVQSKVLVEPQKLLGSARWTCLASGHLGPTPSLCLSTWDGEGGKGGILLLLELAPLIAGPVARGLADVLKLTHTRGHGSSEDPFQILLPLSLARPLWPASHFLGFLHLRGTLPCACSTDTASWRPSCRQSFSSVPQLLVAHETCGEGHRSPLGLGEEDGIQGKPTEPPLHPPSLLCRFFW